MNPNGRYDSRYDHPDTYEQYPNFYQEDQMMGSRSGGGRRIASSTRGGGGMSFPEVRQTKDILRYGRNTQIVQYEGGGGRTQKTL